MNIRFEGRVAIVTGAGNGLGRQCEVAPKSTAEQGQNELSKRGVVPAV